ncbi:MAG: response regulator [Bacteroidetes bacterium]|nr:response regulator [Bacteroidota bacterium]
MQLSDKYNELKKAFSKLSGLALKDPALTNSINETRDLLDKFEEELLQELADKQKKNEDYKTLEFRYKALIEHSNDVIFCVDKNGYYQFVNNVFASTLGHTPEYFEGKSFWDIYPKEHADHRQAASLRIFETGMPGSIEVTVPLPDRTLYYLATTNPVKDDEGNIIMNLTHAVDITERRLMEEALKNSEKQLTQLNAAKDKFFSIIAHDLKGPIGTIANLLNQQNINSIKPEFIQLIQSAAQNTFELMEDLLTWAGAQQNQIDIAPRNFEVNQILRKVAITLQLSARQKGIQFIIPDESEEIFAYGDMPTINTVIRNLVSNAIKFTNEGGKITLSVSVMQDKIQIRISDTGIGIAPDKLSHLFQLGHDVSSPGTKAEKGTGMGLLLCKEFVELNNGEIGVESELNKGSVFWFSLPSGSKTEIENIMQKIKEKSLETLIVEDNSLNLQNTITEISKAGIRYDFALTGAEAIVMGCSKQYDFILMDIHLPGKDGIEANRVIREKYPNAVIIAISSYSKTEIQQKNKMVHFNDFLSKPLNISDLLLILKKIFVDK